MSSGRFSPKSQEKIRNRRQEIEKEKHKTIEEERRKKREQKREKTRSKIEGKLYEYQTKTIGLPNICLTRKEMTDIMRNIPEISEEDFKEKICDPISKYDINMCSKKLNSISNFSEVYPYFLNKYKPKENIKIIYTPNIEIEKEIDIVFLLKDTRLIKGKTVSLKKTYDPVYINPKLKDILYNQEKDTIVAVNISTRELEKKIGHRILVEIIKRGYKVYITIINTRCMSDWRKKSIEEGFKKIYSIINLPDIDLTFYYEFDKYIGNKVLKSLNEEYGKYSWTLDQYTLEINRICTKCSIQLG
jgi:hypothetical protein